MGVEWVWWDGLNFCLPHKHFTKLLCPFSSDFTGTAHNEVFGSSGTDGGGGVETFPPLELERYDGGLWGVEGWGEVGRVTSYSTNGLLIILRVYLPINLVDVFEIIPIVLSVHLEFEKFQFMSEPTLNCCIVI